MVLMLFVGALLAVASFYTFVLPDQTAAARHEPSAEAVARALLSRHKAAVVWCQQHAPCPDGAVVLGDDSALAVGYRQAPWITVTVENNVLATYVSGLAVDPHAIALALAGLSHGNRNVGLAASDGGVVRALSYRGTVAWGAGSLAAPAAVPLGAPVALTTVP